MAAEIVLPITTPESEWVRGRPLRKMSPTRDHGRVQMKFAFALDAWARERGEVATEWRFRIAVPGEARRPLVPDVAFVEAERLVHCSDAEVQSPAFAPTVAIEILSPNDDARDVASEIDVYLHGRSARSSPKRSTERLWPPSVRLRAPSLVERRAGGGVRR